MAEGIEADLGAKLQKGAALFGHRNAPTLNAGPVKPPPDLRTRRGRWPEPPLGARPLP